MQAPATDTLDNSSPEERLRALGIQLPPAASAVGDYAPAIVTGNLLMTSGQLPWIAGDLKFKGKIGAELSIEQGYQAFHLSVLNAISQIRKVLGSLEIACGRSCGSKARSAARRASPSNRACSTAPRMSSTRYSVRAAAIPAWSIPTTRCRWIARRSSCFSPRSPTRAKRRSIAAQIPVSAPRCGRKGFR